MLLRAQEHLEAIASGPALHRHYLALGGDPDCASTPGVFQRADAGDERAALAIRDSAGALGRAIAGVVTVFDPAVVIVSGGMAGVGEPMRDPVTMAQMARAVVDGGAAAVRAQGLDDIRRVAAAVPVIGQWKDGKDGVFITPTLEHAVAVAEAGAHIVALDGTRRGRPDGLDLAQTVARSGRGAGDGRLRVAR